MAHNKESMVGKEITLGHQARVIYTDTRTKQRSFSIAVDHSASGFSLKEVVSSAETVGDISGSGFPDNGEDRTVSRKLENITVTKIVKIDDDDGIRSHEAKAVKKISRDSTHDCVVFLSVIIVCMFNMGLMFSFGAVFPHVLKKFQESRASTAAIQSIFYGVGRCTGLISGIIVQCNGPRNSGVIGAVLYSAGLITSAFATSTIYMQISYGIVSGLGYGFLFISAFQAVGQCFSGQTRLIAVSVGTAAVGVGSVVYPYVVDWLVTSYGLKGTLLILGGITMNAVPLAFTWATSEPTTKASSSDKSAMSCGVCSTVISTLKYAPFLFVFVGIGLSLTAATVFEILALDILKSAGISSHQSMIAYVTLQAVSIPARLVPGFINRIPGCSSIMSPVIGSMLGGLGMVLLNYTSNFTGCIVLFLVNGIARGIIVSCQSVVSLKMLGTDKYSTGLGLILCFSGICTTASGPINGFLRDVSGSYIASLYGAAGVMFLSLILCLISMLLHSRIKTVYKNAKVAEAGVVVFTVTRF